MDGMSCRIDGYVRRELAVVPDLYFCHVNDSTVVVGEEVLSDFDMCAVIAVKRRVNKSVFGFSQQFFHNFPD